MSGIGEYLKASTSSTEAPASYHQPNSFQEEVIFVGVAVGNN